VVYALKGDWGHALDFFDKAGALFPRVLEPYFYRALVYLQQYT
jgi:hypothetical protein